MIPIETYYSNITFSAEECKDLHGTLIHHDNAPDEIETCWKLSEEELKHIAQTGCIYLYTMGRWIPPVMLSVISKVATEDRCHG
jgi:hypothetical protein